jgi:hypothetical protein
MGMTCRVIKWATGGVGKADRQGVQRKIFKQKGEINGEV